MLDSPQLSIEACRVRQHRLRSELAAMSADRALLFAPENVQWLTGFRPHRLMLAVALLDLDGECTLIAPGDEPAAHAADKVISFETQWLSTLRQDQMQAAVQQVPTSNAVTAVEFSVAPLHFFRSFQANPLDVDATMWALRRKKESDEMDMLRKAISCTAAMYARAREILRPGISELEVYQQLQAVAVETAGEPLTDLGNDYQCNSRGGPPRLRKTHAGELMILDLGPAYRGYYADNCRTFAVDRHPTDEQLRAREVILSVFDLVKSFVKPGASCRELFERAQAMLDDYVVGAFDHHLGHGLGLYPHEAPHLNPAWDDRFEEGDVFTVEPGLYHEALRAGIRIEENFQVTTEGVQQLTSSSTEL